MLCATSNAEIKTLSVNELAKLLHSNELAAILESGGMRRTWWWWPGGQNGYGNRYRQPIPRGIERLLVNGTLKKRARLSGYSQAAGTRGADSGVGAAAVTSEPVALRRVLRIDF